LGGSFALLKGENVKHCELAPETVITITGSRTTAIFTEEFLLLNLRSVAFTDEH